MVGRSARYGALRTAGLVTLAAMTAPGAALAADPSPEPTGLEEVVVTARRVEENLQRVPVTVTALSGEQLKRQNIVAPNDLQFAAPSVMVAPSVSRVGGGFTVRGLPSGVVTYFAEVPGGPTTLSTPYFDLNSVQVLNGPQGTLFGRTAAAGAVLVTPRRPEMEAYGGYLDVSTGDYGRLQATAVVNAPLIAGELAARLVYHREHVGGFTEQIAPTQIIPGLPNLTNLGQKLDEVNSDSFRASLEWRRGAFRNYIVANYILVDQSGSAQVLSYANPNLPLFNLTPAQATAQFTPACAQAVAQRLATSVSACISQRLAITQQFKAAVTAEQARITAGGDNAVRSVPALQGTDLFDKARHRSVMDIAQYDFGDLGPTTLRVKNLFSYQDDVAVSAYALDGVGAILLAAQGPATGRGAGSVNQVGNRSFASFGEPTRVLTEEFQLQGTALDVVQWTAGYYYQETKVAAHDDGVGVLSRTSSGIFTPNLGWTPSASFPRGTKAKETAGYGQVTLDLNELGVVHGLSLTGGYRRTKNKSVARLWSAVLDPAGTGTYVPGPATPDAFNESEGSNYTFTVNEQVTPDLFVYASLSKSFTPGGSNLTIGCNLAPNCKATFEPTTVKNYEFGVKSQLRLGDVDLRLNATAYRMNFSNIQQSFRFVSGATTIVYIGNVAEARMQGLETHVDAVWSRFTVSANYNYLDAKYREWRFTDLNNQFLAADVCQPGSAAGLCLLDLSGNPFPNAPEHQIQAQLRYDLPVDEALGHVWVSLKAYYQSRQYHTQAAFRELEVARARGLGDITEAISQKAYTTLNARLEWDNIGGSSISGALFVNNLTDETYAQGGSSRAVSSGTAVKLYAPPRMWGVNLVYRFGSEAGS